MEKWNPQKKFLKLYWSIVYMYIKDIWQIGFEKHSGHIQPCGETLLGILRMSLSMGRKCFLLLNSNDPGGCWWPPSYSTWIPTTVSFIFLVSVFVAQFIIFGNFQVLNFQSSFEALNDVFLENWGQRGYFIVVGHSKFVFLIYLFLRRYCVCQTEIVCQNYKPKKLMYQFTQTCPQFSISFLRVRFLDVYGFLLFLNHKQTFEPHCNIVQRHIAATSLLRDKLLQPKLILFPFCL